MNSWWWADVVSVDGKPIPQNSAIVQLAPGKHTIKYVCGHKFQLNDTGGAASEGTTDANFETGKTYFAFVGGRMTSYENFGAAGIKSRGTCEISSFETQNPRWLP